MHRLRSLLRTRRRRISAALTLLIALLAFTPGWLFALASLGGEDGIDAPASSNYRVILLDGFDANRSREVPARLFWPNSARQGHVPLVLFSHGIGSSDDGYTHLGHYWARHGIASLHVRHVGSDREMWQGNLLQVAQRFASATAEPEALARVADLRWALDHLLTERFGEHIDPDRITVAGHSYGANTAMLLAGARVMREGRLLQLGDTRIAAAILISAPPFYGESNFAPILGGIAVPSLHVTTTDDIIRLPGFGSGVADREKVFNAIGGDKTLAIFNRGSHNVFTDRRYFDTADVADSVKASTQRLTLAFLKSLNDTRGGRFTTLEALTEPGLVVRSAEAADAVESKHSAFAAVSVSAR
ncbi:alpha/beta hydrolase family protein [Aquimonas sp.]|jgi:pimeloyl-ACP methyl ester carboxylesterase|uniref:alpha/beta hydrolase family protein n=1 Tax=Aquimonas sp. TaxID=1872588 RepID=UPI0037C05D68